MKSFKNIFLMLLVNVGIMITLSIVLSLIGANRYMTANGLDLETLAIFCLVWGMGASFISLLLSKVIAKWIYGVKLLSPNDPSGLYEMVARASQAAGLPKVPDVGIYESPELNAFATGPSKSNALVAVSSGLLNSMDRAEVEGVIGHEVAHIANGDMVTMTLLQGVVNALVMFVARIVAYGVSSMARGNDRDRGSPWLYFIVLHLTEFVLGIFGMIVVNWFSRRREFRADAGSARIFGREKMIAALQALGSRSKVFDKRGESLASFKIANRRASGFMALLSTHPPLEERIEALRTQAI